MGTVASGKPVPPGHQRRDMVLRVTVTQKSSHCRKSAYRVLNMMNYEKRLQCVLYLRSP